MKLTEITSNMTFQTNEQYLEMTRKSNFFTYKVARVTVKRRGRNSQNYNHTKNFPVHTVEELMEIFNVNRGAVIKIELDNHAYDMSKYFDYVY
jgi:hypothetical protein